MGESAWRGEPRPAEDTRRQLRGARAAVPDPPPLTPGSSGQHVFTRGPCSGSSREMPSCRAKQVAKAGLEPKAELGRGHVSAPPRPALSVGECASVQREAREEEAGLTPQPWPPYPARGGGAPPPPTVPDEWAWVSQRSLSPRTRARGSHINTVWGDNSITRVPARAENPHLPRASSSRRVQRRG